MVGDSETINVRLSRLQAEILTKYTEDTPEVNHKDWLKNIIDPNSVKTDEGNSYSDKVIDFFDTYIDLKSEEIEITTVRKANVIKNTLIKYEEYCRKNKKSFKYLRFKDLDNKFRKDFEEYCKKDSYQISTIYKNLKFLKTVCNVAQSFDIEVHKNVWNWTFNIEKVTKNNPKSIYLTFEELDKIEKTKMPKDYLDNARDWLLISCYTGQRVSDYLYFNSSMITADDEGMKYIEFIQKKTLARMRLPLLNKVEEILKKRNGEFPRKISEPRLNQYIKEVCQVAGIDEILYHGKAGKIEDKNRKIYGKYHKYELVTSHIGRKSFASNFYGKLPTTYILNFTGHTTEKQLLTYIGKSEVEKSKDKAKYLKDLGY